MTLQTITALVSTVLAAQPQPCRNALDFRRELPKQQYQTVLTKFRIKPGRTERVRQFFEGVHNRPREFAEVLAESGIFYDASFIEQTSTGDVLFVFKRLTNLDHLKDRISNSKLAFFDVVRRELADHLEERLDLPAISVFIKDEV